ncbi:MAG: porin family protein [Treponema sp.]|jgi:hypothetical protein|nr:porin family protein [Treponema sp.]
MKKVIFGVLMLFLTFPVFAQNWSLGGEIYAGYSKWDNSDTSGDNSKFYFGVSAGWYFTEKISAGIMGTFDFLDKVNTSKSFGPFFQYDFLKYALFSFGVSGSFLYITHNDSYKWSNTYTAIDAEGIALNGSILFNFTPNKNVELYIGLLSIGYEHYWLTLPDSNLKCTDDRFIVTSSPVSNIKLGIKFKF